MSDFLYIDSAFDDAGLDASEFRVAAHLYRRQNEKRGGYAWPGKKSIARVCRLNEKTVERVLKSLVEKNVITEDRSMTTQGAGVYRKVNHPSVWRVPHPKAGPRVHNGGGLKQAPTGGVNKAPRGTPKQAPQRKSREGNPLKAPTPNPLPGGGGVGEEVVEELYRAFPLKETWRTVPGEKQRTKNAIRVALTKIDAGTLRAAVMRYKSELVPSTRVPGFYVSIAPNLVDSAYTWFFGERWKIYNFPAAEDTSEADHVAGEGARAS